MTIGATRGAAPFGWRVDRLRAIDSTNEEARRRALDDDPGRLWIVADEQTAGRGRHGRTWVSLKGNLHASALLIDPCPQARSPQLGFVAGVALARAAEDAGAMDAKLKWPNDLVSSGAKCAGLLLEGAALPDRRLACVIGVGVNCATAPDGVGYPTAALRRADGRAIAAAGLFERLAERFAETLDLWDAGDGFDAVRAEWLERAHAIGAVVSIEDARGRREGVFDGIDGSGRLLFRGGQGLETIEAADLFLSPGGDASAGAVGGRGSLARGDSQG